MGTGTHESTEHFDGGWAMSKLATGGNGDPGIVKMACCHLGCGQIEEGIYGQWDLRGGLELTHALFTFSLEVAGVVQA